MNPYQEFYKLREQSVKANEDVMGIDTPQGHETLLLQQCSCLEELRGVLLTQCSPHCKGWGEARRRRAPMLELLCNFLTLRNHT